MFDICSMCFYSGKKSQIEPVFLNVWNRFQGMNSASLCSLAGRYDNPIPARFLAPIDCFKIPALVSQEIKESPSGQKEHSWRKLETKRN